MTARRFKASNYVEGTVHFRCNLRCPRCMIKGTINWLHPKDNATFGRKLSENREHRRWIGLTLTDTKVTMLSDLAAAARAAGSGPTAQCGRPTRRNLITCRRLVLAVPRDRVHAGDGEDVGGEEFARCLLGAYGDALDNGQPELVIDPAFWPDFMRDGLHQCSHREICTAEDCLGLNTAYIHRSGWQADLLPPLVA